MKYSVNDRSLHYNAEGEKIQGDDRVLLDDAVDLTLKTSWTEQGYTLSKLFSDEVYSAFIKKTHDLLIDLWRNAGLKVPDHFRLDQYHHIANSTDSHFAAIEKTKLINTALFPVHIHIVEDAISKICNEPLVAKNPFDGQSIFHFRVIRPQQPDNNPLHRDVWLEDFEDCINLYIPITGSNENSSLVIIPGSHRWPESKIERTLSGAQIDGIKFNVPAVTALSGEFNSIRPNPGDNKVLVFSPYLIHGGSANLNKDQTRISIELRLWKK